MSYNGWVNYETWLYHLHNTDGMCLEEYFHSRLTVERLADFLKEDAYEKIDENHLLIPYHKDVIGASLSEVNFTEIAERLFSEFFETKKSPQTNLRRRK